LLVFTLAFVYPVAAYSLIIFGEFASQTEGLLLSLPNLCTGLEEALLLRTGAAQGA
jgi:hypothetical protein